jgi:hypothetical protein
MHIKGSGPGCCDADGDASSEHPAESRDVMNEDRTPTSRWRTPSGIFMLVAGAVGVYYLLTEHLTHVTQGKRGS